MTRKLHRVYYVFTGKDYSRYKDEQFFSVNAEIQRKRRAISDIRASKILASTPPKIHFRKIDGRDTRTSNFPAYKDIRENCEFRSSASRYFIKWILVGVAGFEPATFTM